jgi:adhesin/invasin
LYKSLQFARRAAISGTALAALLSGACKSSSSVTSPQAAAIAPSNASNNQLGTAGKILPRPAEVVVTDAGGNPVRGATVTWTVAAGSGLITGSSDTTTFATTFTTVTDDFGVAGVTWELGPNPGTDTITAVTGEGSTTTITATAQPATSSQLRRAGDE